MVYPLGNACIVLPVISLDDVQIYTAQSLNTHSDTGFE